MSENSTRFRCYGCSKVVSSPLPADAVLRAIAWCPECIEAGRDQIGKFTRGDVQRLRQYARFTVETDDMLAREAFDANLAWFNSLADRIEAALQPEVK